MSAQERVLTVSDMDYALKCWGESQADPILALHGWLDNAASFDVLAPLLAAKGYYVVAVDLAGHGLTSHRPPSGGYQIWDDLPDLLALVDALGWTRFSVLGHSRGAMISLLLTVAVPERVRTLLLIDGLQPTALAANESAAQLQNAIRDYRKYLGREPRAVFDSIDAAVKQRCASRHLPLSATAARGIVARNLSKQGEAYAWRFDQRLRAASMFKLTDAHNAAMLAALAAPTLLLMASAGLAKSAESQRAIEHSIAPVRDFKLIHVIGPHHCHMDGDTHDIANQLLTFLAAHA